MIKLMRRNVVGTGEHRSGWPFAVGALRPLHSENGILFDDFVESSFLWGASPGPHREPWIGVFHHPPGIPTWLAGDLSLEAMMGEPGFRASLPSLRLAICLSAEHARRLHRALGVPTAAIWHPTETPQLKFTEAAYTANDRKQIVQVGFWLRNLQAIQQLPDVPGFAKVRLVQAERWVRVAEERTLHYWSAVGARPDWGSVHEIQYLDNAAYDALLARNVVFLELFDSSANNVIIECIVRNTPVLVNRLPALEEYLGPDYPLFYQDLVEASRLVTDQRVLQAHRHLVSLDKSRFRANRFAADVAAAVRACVRDTSGLFSQPIEDQRCLTIT